MDQNNTPNDGSTEQKPINDVMASAPDENTPMETPAPVETVTPAATPEAAPAATEAPATAEVASSIDPASSTAPAAQPEPIVHHKSGSPVAAIVAAVLVAIGLAAVTVYAYMQSQADQKSDTSQSASSDQQTQQGDTAKDLDDTTTELDAAVKDTEEQTMPASDVEDKNLNL